MTPDKSFSMHANRTATKARPGGRTARTRKAILDAALMRLLSGGYEGLSVGIVAADAGVAETTVYRRWPTKSHLAAAALAELAAADNPTPDTGSFEGDLRRMLDQIVDLIERPEIQRVMRAIAALSSDVPGMAEARSAFLQARVASMERAIERAERRHEVPDGLHSTVVLETLVAPAYLRLLVTGLPLDQALVDRSIATTLELIKNA